MSGEDILEEFLKIWSREYKKGFLTYFILLLLKENPMYGLEIADNLKEIMGGSVRLHGSNIYQILKKLKKNGMVSSKRKNSIKGPARKYYYIEPNGIRLLQIFTEKYILPLHFGLVAALEKHYPEMIRRRQK